MKPSSLLVILACVLMAASVLGSPSQKNQKFSTQNENLLRSDLSPQKNVSDTVKLELQVANLLGILVTIPTAIYSVTDLTTGVSGTIYNSNFYNIPVSAGDVLYLNSFGLPLSLDYTVTASDVSNGLIVVQVLNP